MNNETKRILQAVRDGALSVDDALLRLKTAPFVDLGMARVDLHRQLRQGTAEVIYGAGKTPEAIRAIVGAMRDNGQDRIIITRLRPEAAAALDDLGLRYWPEARFALAGDMPRPDGIGDIVVAAAGTSDIPVAEEAALTAEAMGNRVTRLYDVGVAGLHRLLSETETIMRASVIVTAAGMEGALASVVGGLADCPVIAVPTSVGYGASFGGLSALLSMLNSCASGVGVVNIDNGFGAGCLASRINHMEAKK